MKERFKTSSLFLVKRKKEVKRVFVEFNSQLNHTKWAVILSSKDVHSNMEDFGFESHSRWGGCFCYL